MAGALGNCYDRLAFGHVRDFVHFHVDPIGFDCAIFNFADNMLVIGAITLVIFALRPEKKPLGDEAAGTPHGASTDTFRTSQPATSSDASRQASQMLYTS